MPGICVAVNATSCVRRSVRYRTLKLWKSRPPAPMMITLCIAPPFGLPLLGHAKRLAALPPLHPDEHRDAEEQQHEALRQPFLTRAPDRPDRVRKREACDRRVTDESQVREEVPFAEEEDDLRRRRVGV